MSPETDPGSEIEGLTEAVAGGERVITLSGLTSVASKAYMLAALRARTGLSFVVVTDSNGSLESWNTDLLFWRQNLADGANGMDEAGPSNIVALPSFESDVYSGLSPHAETHERRALSLWQAAHGDAAFLIVSARSLITRTVTPAEIKAAGARLALDDEMPPGRLIALLASAGYVREDPLFNIGQFSARGGIVDVWSPDAAAPVRIEFFGDTIDSMREFDADTQLSTGKLSRVSLAPMREITASESDFRDWSFFARERFAAPEFTRTLKDRTELADTGESFSGWEFLLPLSHPAEGSAFDYFGDSVLVIDEPVVIEETLRSFYSSAAARFTRITEAGDIGLRPDELFLDGAELRSALEQRRLVELRSLGKIAGQTDEDFALPQSSPLSGNRISADPATDAVDPLFLFPTAAGDAEFNITSRSTQKFHGKVGELADRLRTTRLQRALFAMDTLGMAERLEELLRDYDFVAPSGSIVVGALSGGFELPSHELAVYSEFDIFGDTARPELPAVKPAVKRRKLGAFISDFRDLKPGDYVVHVDHGIGRFEGLETITAQGAEREFVLLVYADNAKLFVPVERLDLVSRYSSGEAAAPSLDRLGGIGWQKTKAKAKRAMRDMADELLRLYAERKLVQGYAFSPDAPWQHEFEDAFPYDLTADQGTAIDDVKADMETPRPMDRLIVGDVGYGKTEVAMRAAFKAVMDGKQVAILTPTTVLAYQHFETFSRRFAAFPACIELLSRFRSPKEQKAVVVAAEKGDVDVLIGTHRVLSNDVKLPKLGLVVVDEEQRFGVAHKEKLKQLKKKIDVLTLSATPIPRTLNMSLLGMRDMSVIETPPRDRLAINTQVIQFSENVVRSAIDLELARNGQVFFIHNRVETIEAIAALVQEIVPNARIAVGHGQMNEKEMEQVMLDFIDYKYDVLVATTIIENGIDIPRANTILINRADNYGLSQLYQLRGRVGRSNRRAYAYLLIPGEIELTPIARRRLSAIREFSDLGAGFRIAALDLELRGAGNILGGQQSGHLDALGFDLYTKMLERTIAEIKGDEIEDEAAVSINLGVDVSIPKDYISEASQRLRTYKRISSAGTEEELMRIHDEIADRYGKVPDSVEQLVAYGRLRRTAESLRIVSIDKTQDGLAIKLSESSRVGPEKLMELVADSAVITFSPAGILRFPVNQEGPIVAATQMLERIRK